MNIKTLSFQNFRNLERLDLELCDTVNVLCGSNAQGKTNIVEGIAMLSGQKSFRTTRDRETVLFGEEKALLQTTFFAGGRDNELVMEVGANRLATLNGLAVEKLTDLLPVFSCVVFSPTHLTLIKDGPEKRRRFLDDCICRISPNYTKYMHDYERVLAQKNAYLKEMRGFFRGGEQAEAMLMSLDMGLSNLGCILHTMRVKYLSRLSEKAQKFYDGISSQAETFRSEYQSTVFTNGTEFADKTAMRAAYFDALQCARDEDIKMGFTTCGVHRDDFCVYIDDKNARLYGSQGQQRSCVLALKMGESEITGEAFGENPVFILDDVMSELDRNRQLFVMNCLRDRQVFITCCDMTDLRGFSDGRVFTIAEGKVTRKRSRKKKE